MSGDKEHVDVEREYVEDVNLVEDQEAEDDVKDAAEHKDVGFPPKPEKLREPVAWLFGPQLIGSLKGIIVHWLYKKLDIRDWMFAPGVVDLVTECHWTQEEQDKNQPFWFDYLADTGDGQKPTYSVAYLVSADLTARLPGDVPIKVGTRLRVPKPKEPSDLERDLPRGRFLFVGGDTAYHVANHVTLAHRFAGPFTWAYADLSAPDEARGDWSEKNKRPLVGIPGNHDYYDMLDGFNRQFRKPVNEQVNAAETKRQTQLDLPGLRRVQETSYVAARLPHDWMLYGFDTEQDELDFRQRQFFLSVKAKYDPKKLIVCTPSPTTVFDRKPSPKDTIYKQLKLAGVTLPAAMKRVDGAVPVGECRLDLSGDVHHYARYWGPKRKDGARASKHYASVVSGLGGAFHHPSSTKHGDLEPQVKYPEASVSNAEVAARLFDPTVIIRGGYIGTIGALIAALTTGAMLSEGPMGLVSNWLVDKLLGWNLKVDASRTAGSLIVFAGLLALIGGVVVGIQIARKTYASDPDAGKARYWLAFGVVAAGIVLYAIAAWWQDLKYEDKPAAFDVTVTLLGIALSIGLVVLAIVRGRDGRKGAGVTTLFVVFGLIHLVMQILAVPMLIKVGAPIAYAVFAWSSLATLPFGYLALRSTSRSAAKVLALWFIFSAWLLVIPFVFHRTPLAEPTLSTKHWVTLIAMSVVLGFFHCCIQFAWYLAASHVFQGHNNEIGGACRIERFKQFIRFKVEADTITGYVIAFKEPKHHGRDLDAFVCDVFTLATKKKGTGNA
jgi:hypothetical protein